VTYTPLEQLHGYICTNGAYKNNSDNIITQIFIGLNKTKQHKKHGCCKMKTVLENVKGNVLKQMYFNVNDKTAITLEYFNLRTNAV
jgi:hypothetical protein